MERNKKAKVIAIVALIVGVIGLSIDFASFSNVLNIQSSANVKPDNSTMNVIFSSAESKAEVTEITPVVTPNSLVATNGIIDNSNDPTFSNLSATFTEPGQTAVYKFYAYNAGELVQKACEKISIKVKVGNEFETSTCKASITGHTLAKENGEAVIITLEYEAGTNRADGDFNVAFGNITLNYSSAD